MSNTLMIEGQMMYHSIKDIDEPKEALEKLATLEPPMGWCDVERLRAISYGMWLKEKGMDDWYDYYEKVLRFLSQIASGNVVDIGEFANMEKPEGWIAPVEYLKGKVV